MTGSCLEANLGFAPLDILGYEAKTQHGHSFAKFQVFPLMQNFTHLSNATTQKHYCQNRVVLIESCPV